MDAKMAVKDDRVKRSIRLDSKAHAPKKAQVLDITVLMGGPSSEREVSLQTGSAIAEALTRLGHRVTRSDISPQDLSSLDRDGMDLVFIALHGAFGEDGQVQEACEARSLRYVGSPPAASRLAMDKAASKEIFKRHGMATADWTIVTRANLLSMRDSVEPLGLPAVVKPIDGGSSVDVTIARDADARDKAVTLAVAKYGRVMVERFVRGKEVTIGVLGSQTLPVIEIRPARDFYDYTAKYTDCGTQYLFDHGLSEPVVAELSEKALAAHQSLGCRDLSRVDFIVDDAGVPHVLEINTIPGFTSHSLLPMAARQAGISFDQLVGRIVEMAMRR